MTTSGTYSADMSVGEVLIEGFSRCQVRRTSLLAEHIKDGSQAIKLAMSKLSVLVPNLWAYEQQTVALVAGTTTYTLPSRSVMILSCFIRTGSGESAQDRILTPASTVEYSSFPNKAQRGFPSVFWFNRVVPPTISFYLTPDDAQTYTAYLQITRQLQDANLASGETPDVPFRFLDALCADVAHRLSRVYAPQLEDKRKIDADDAWRIAATNDVENVAMNVVPMIGGYYR
jgi:hypothetical protein